jgi:hypothetical protein
LLPSSAKPATGKVSRCWQVFVTQSLLRPVGYSLALDGSPMLFTPTAIVHAGGALFFAYIAAGYEAAGITRWVGWRDIEAVLVRLIACRLPTSENET